jgi:predicted nucleic acid-binding protein
MLIADTGPLVAMLNAKDRHHEACTSLFRRFRGPVIVPAPIVTEVAYFLQIEPGPRRRGRVPRGAGPRRTDRRSHYSAGFWSTEAATDGQGTISPPAPTP